MTRNTYTMTVNGCTILLDFGFKGSADDFFRLIDENRFLSTVKKSIEHAGYKDITLKFEVMLHLTELGNIRRKIRSIAQKNKPILNEASIVDVDYKNRDVIAYVKTSDEQKVIYVPLTARLSKLYYLYYNHYFNEHNVEHWNAENFTSEIEKHVKRHYEEEVLEFIPHEITHLWHLKKSGAIEYAKRNLRRMYRLKEKNLDYSLMSPGLFKLPNLRFFTSTFKELTTHLFEFYIDIRNRYLLFSKQICTEGMAEFMRFYVMGKLDADKILGDAEKAARELRAASTKIHSAFRLHVNFLKVIEEELEKEYSFDIIVTEARRKAYEARLGDIRSGIEVLRKNVYIVGPAIQTTLYYNGYSIEQIGEMSPSHLLKEYSKVCKRNNLEPLVGLTMFQPGIFNIRHEVNNLNKLRRDLKILKRSTRKL